MQKKISIIVATKNRLPILIESALKNIDAIKNYNCEYIIVNDGDEFILQAELNQVLLLNNKQQGVSSARNLGANAATGELLFFIDDDMWITAATMDNIYEIRSKIDFDNNVFVMNWEYPAQLQQIMRGKKIGRYILKSNYHTLQGRAKMNINYKDLLVPMHGIGSGSFLIKKSIFETIGGYNQTIFFEGEDIDISNKLRDRQINIFLSTKITCFHNQKDRIDIDGFLLRLQQGYKSQVKAGMTDFKSYKIKIYTFLLPIAPFFKMLFKLIPNVPFFDSFSFRLIGILSSLTYAKEINLNYISSQMIVSL